MSDEDDVYESDFQSTEEESDAEDPLAGEKVVEYEAKKARKVGCAAKECTQRH